MSDEKTMWSALAKVSGDGVEMETDLAGRITREFVGLINQGWTPPEMSSAAPDMYRALREAVEKLSEMSYRTEDALDIARWKAALAKADGEQS